MAVAFLPTLARGLRHPLIAPRRAVRRCTRRLVGAPPAVSRLCLAATPPRMALRVTPVPTLSDNYAYLISDTITRKAVAVDPAQPARMLAAAAAAGVTITEVWCTHRHPDHSAGNEALVAALARATGGAGTSAGVAVVASGVERDGVPVPGTTVSIRDGAAGRVAGTAIGWEAIHTPGHTDGHMCFVVRDVTVPAAAVDVDGLGADAPPVTVGEAGEAVVVVPALFSGDALFLGGCGRLFDGTPAEALTSLDRLVAALPPATAVYCGHEYTQTNLRFAAAVEPRSTAVAAAADRVRAVLGDAPWGDARRGTSVPGWLGVEVDVNPFLRVREPTVAAAVGKEGGDAATVMGALRRWKDRF